MKPEEKIHIGMSSVLEFAVEEQHSAPHIGSGSVYVLATPAMISFMEITARKLFDAHLPDSHTSVGTHVDVRHLAACPVGESVIATVEVKEIDGRRIRLSVQVQFGLIIIGSGTHERVVVNREKFLARLPR